MIEISKELLEEILKVKVLKHKLNIKSLKYDYFKNGVEYTSFSINIHELAHKIEDWIESKSINIIRIKENNLYEFYINSYIDESYKVLVFEDSITSDSKIDGIVAVAEFILNKVSK